MSADGDALLLAGAETEVESQPQPAALEDDQRDEAVVIQTGSLAATILATPLIASVARRGPVDVVVRGEAAALLANNPSIRHLFPYERAPEDLTDLAALWRTLRAVRGRRTVDGAGWRAGRERRATRIAYVADSSLRSALLAVFAGIEQRVGFTSAAGRALFTKCVPFDEARHHAERLWSLAAPEGAPSPTAAQLRPRLFPGAAETAAVDALLGEAGKREEPLIALAPGASRPTKRWPAFAALAERLARRARLVVVGGRDAADAASAVVAAARGRAIDATGQLSLLASAELIGRAALLVANDSTPVQLAAAMGTPTIAVFGPTVPEFGFRPASPGSRSVGHTGLACRPCDRRGPQRCPLGHWRCMREISAADVDRLIEESSLHSRT